MINIGSFALPDAALFNPRIAGGFLGLNLIAWKINYLFFMQKAYAMFAMLFGAGTILMYQRASEKGIGYRGVYYRRLLWLFLFGMLHAYFLWFGDILVAYALCGLVLYPLRKLKARTLLIIGATIYLIGVPAMIASGSLMNWMHDTAVEVRAADQAGEEVTEMQRNMANAWEETEAYYHPSQEEIQRQIDIHRGSYNDIFKFRAPIVLMLQTQAFLFVIAWRTLGLMLIGMALMKFDFFAARKSLAFYSYFGAGCYILGLLLVGTGISRLMLHNFAVIHKIGSDGIFNLIGSVPVALGHVSVIMVCCKLGLFDWLKQRIVAVGRMAFSNYIFQSLVFTTIFYGYGFGLYAKVDRVGLWGFVLGMWIVQLWLSPLWLRYFRYGPLEWLWRSLTYRQRQPFRNAM